MNLVQFRSVIRKREYYVCNPLTMERTGKKEECTDYVKQYRERVNILEIGIKPPVWSEWMDMNFYIERD